MPYRSSYKLPYIDSISNLKHHYTQFLQRLTDGPIVLTQHGKAVAVLVGLELWDTLNNEQVTTNDPNDPKVNGGALPLPG